MALNSLGSSKTQTIGSQTWLAVKGKIADAVCRHMAQGRIRQEGR